MMKHFTLKNYVLLLLTFYSLTAAADKVRGRLIDASGEAIIGATVIIENTKFGTVTDGLGVYEIKNLAPGDYKLKFTYIGYETTYLTVSAVPDNSTATPSTKMKEDLKSLDDVVVVGYGTKLKREMTGSIAKINAKELNDMPVQSFEGALQAKTARCASNHGERYCGFCFSDSH